MSAMEDGKITQRDVAAIFQGDGFVADAGILRLRRLASAAAAEPFAPNLSGAKNRNIFHTLTPNQAVMPMAVTVVLKLVPRVWLGCVILTCGSRFRGNDDSSRVQVQSHLALQMN